MKATFSWKPSTRSSSLGSLCEFPHYTEGHGTRLQPVSEAAGTLRALLPHEASGSRMGVRVWGVAEDRLIEVQVYAARPGAGLSIEGLPEGRSRTTADRVRAALVNSGIVSEAPAVLIRLEPAVPAGRTSELDLTVALAALAYDGRLSEGLRWIFAKGRLGLDGSVFSSDLEERVSLVRFVTALAEGVA